MSLPHKNAQGLTREAQLSRLRGNNAEARPICCRVLTGT